jgi:uncharacterized protein YerC
MAFVPATYEIRTKIAKSRGLEKDGRRERILSLRRDASVQRFIGDFCTLAGRERIFGAVRLAAKMRFGLSVRRGFRSIEKST